jgi:hypothetical protein
MTQQYLLIAGNPVSGFQYVGPFTTSSEAHDEGEQLGFEEYWITQLAAPSQEEEV